MKRNKKGRITTQPKTVKRGNIMSWSEPEGFTWEATPGIWKHTASNQRQPNMNPSITFAGGKPDKADVVCAYIDYLRQALKTKSGGGDVDWSTHNAKRLVWDLGNQRTLSSVRNIVSWFSKSEGIPLQTLRTGNSGRSGAEANAQAIKDIKATVGDLSDVTKS